MKLKDGFVLRQVAGQTIVLPTGANVDLNVMITLNETGKVLWNCLERGAEESELVQALLAEFDVDEAMAKSDVADFVARLREHDFFQ